MIYSTAGFLLTACVAILATGQAVALPGGASSLAAGYSRQQQQQQLQQVPPPPSAGFLTGAALGARAFAAAGLGAGEGFEPDGGYSDGMGPPDPSKFRSPQDLKEYLERLQLYYALVGRPRFGKRSSGGFAIDRFRSNENDSAAADDEEPGRSVEGRRASVAGASKDRGSSGKIYGFAVIF